MKTCHTWLLCVWLAFPALATRQVVDDAGHTVTVPTQVQRIADSWFAHHSVLMTLGRDVRLSPPSTIHRASRGCSK